MLTLLYIVTALFYLAGIALSYRQPWRTAWRWALLLPIMLHGGLLAYTIHGTGAINFNWANAVSCVAWVCIAIFWLAQWRYVLYTLQAYLLTMALLGLCLEGLLHTPHILSYTPTPLLHLHLGLGILAYSTLTLASALAIWMLWLEKSLQKHQQPKGRMPPLLLLERILFQLIKIGFGLLSITLFSGFLFAESIFGKAFHANHKMVFGVLSWLIYASLLWGRHQYGWRGKQALRWSLSGFLLLFLAYFGSKFVLEIILKR